MKKTMIVAVVLIGIASVASDAFASINWVSSSHSSRGGYFRDTSNDGNPFNNANYLGYNE